MINKTSFSVYKAQGDESIVVQEAFRILINPILYSSSYKTIVYTLVKLSC